MAIVAYGRLSAHTCVVLRECSGESLPSVSVETATIAKKVDSCCLDSGISIVCEMSSVAIV